MTDFETRAMDHANMLSHQLREAVTEYASEMDLTGEKLAKLLKDKGITEIAPEPTVASSPLAITDESCNWMLENAGQLGLADCLVILEALGAEVNITVAIPVQERNKLLTPKKAHKLAVASHLDEATRKLQRKRR